MSCQEEPVLLGVGCVVMLQPLLVSLFRKGRGSV